MLKDNKVNDFSGILIVVLSSICFAVVPSSAKIALDNGSSLLVLLFSRCLIGLLLLTPLILIKKQGVFFSNRIFFAIIFTSIVSVSLIAVTYHAINFLDIALVLMILYLFPLGIALITHLSNEEFILPIQWFCILLIIFGISLIIIDGSFKGNIYGFFVSILGLLLMIVFIFTSGKLANLIGSAIMNFHINLWSSLILGFLIFSTDIIVKFPENSKGWFAIFSNGFFYVLSYFLFYEGSKRLGITRTSVLAAMEPIFAAIFALILLNQFLTLTETIGFIIIVLSIYFFEKFRVNKKIKKNIIKKIP